MNIAFDSVLPEPSSTTGAAFTFAAVRGSVMVRREGSEPAEARATEGAVLLASRWILAVLRNHRFFSLSEVRDAVKLLVRRLNDRVMKKLKKSRREFFNEVEKSELKPLPSMPYEFADWERPRVGLKSANVDSAHAGRAPLVAPCQTRLVR